MTSIQPPLSPYGIILDNQTPIRFPCVTLTLIPSFFWLLRIVLVRPRVRPRKCGGQRRRRYSTGQVNAALLPLPLPLSLPLSLSRPLRVRLTLFPNNLLPSVTSAVSLNLSSSDLNQRSPWPQAQMEHCPRTWPTPKAQRCLLQKRALEGKSLAARRTVDHKQQ